MCDKYQELLQQSSVRGGSDEDEERSAVLVGGQDRVRQLKHNLEVRMSILMSQSETLCDGHPRSLSKYPIEKRGLVCALFHTLSSASVCS